MGNCEDFLEQIFYPPPSPLRKGGGILWIASSALQTSSQ